MIMIWSLHELRLSEPHDWSIIRNCLIGQFDMKQKNCVFVLRLWALWPWNRGSLAQNSRKSAICGMARQILEAHMRGLKMIQPTWDPYTLIVDDINKYTRNNKENCVISFWSTGLESLCAENHPNQLKSTDFQSLPAFWRPPRRPFECFNQCHWCKIFFLTNHSFTYLRKKKIVLFRFKLWQPKGLSLKACQSQSLSRLLNDRMTSSYIHTRF